MKYFIMLAAILLMLTAVFVGTRQFKEQISQECGQVAVVEKHVNWVWQWLPKRDAGKGFIACIGPSSFIVYRPLDVAALLLVGSFGLILSTTKKRQITTS